MIMFHNSFCALIGLLIASTTNGMETSTVDMSSSSLENMSRDLLTGSIAAPLNAYPWFAQPIDGAATQPCGGALITPEYVLTSASCVTPAAAGGPLATITATPSSYLIGARTTTPGNGGQLSISANVDTIYVHPTYVPATAVNDFALVKLAKRVTTIAPVKLDQGTVSSKYAVGESKREFHSRFLFAYALIGCYKITIMSFVCKWEKTKRYSQSDVSWYV